LHGAHQGVGVIPPASFLAGPLFRDLECESVLRVFHHGHDQLIYKHEPGLPGWRRRTRSLQRQSRHRSNQEQSTNQSTNEAMRSVTIGLSGGLLDIPWFPGLKAGESLVACVTELRGRQPLPFPRGLPSLQQLLSFKAFSFSLPTLGVRFPGTYSHCGREPRENG